LVSIRIARIGENKESGKRNSELGNLRNVWRVVIEYLWWKVEVFMVVREREETT
jgi:hypothetical protein